MVDNIKAAFAKRVEAIDWMAPATKQEALKKVETIVVGVGYPDTWRDYSGAADHGRQCLRQPASGRPVRIPAPDRQARQADGPRRMVDDAADGQRGQPAGAERAQLPGGDPRPPFFDPKADAGANYGAIGAMIGHEISHSFDNNGALFDSTGRAAQLVDARRTSPSSSRPATRWPSSIDAYEPLPGPARQRQADARREYRRRRRARAPPTTPTGVAGRQAGAGDRRLDRRPALLPRLRPGLGGKMREEAMRQIV